MIRSRTDCWLLVTTCLIELWHCQIGVGDTVMGSSWGWNVVRYVFFLFYIFISLFFCILQIYWMLVWVKTIQGWQKKKNTRKIRVMVEIWEDYFELWEFINTPNVQSYCTTLLKVFPLDCCGVSLLVPNKIALRKNVKIVRVWSKENKMNLENGLTLTVLDWF